MDCEDLDKKIQAELDQGNKPFMVSTLVGSTVEGAIDNLEEISKITKKYKIWHHVDACYAGGIFFSDKLIKKPGDCS